MAAVLADVVALALAAAVAVDENNAPGKLAQSLAVAIMLMGRGRAGSVGRVSANCRVVTGSVMS